MHQSLDLISAEIYEPVKRQESGLLHVTMCKTRPYEILNLILSFLPLKNSIVENIYNNKYFMENNKEVVPVQKWYIKKTNKIQERMKS